MKFITALSALPVVTAGSLRKLKSDPDSLFNLSPFSPPPGPATNTDFFSVSEEEPKLQQSSFTDTLDKNNGDSKLPTYVTLQRTMTKFWLIRHL